MTTANLICQTVSRRIWQDAHWLRKCSARAKCGKPMTHWSPKEYDFRDGVQLYSEMAQNISTEGVQVMTGDERAAYDFRSLNVQPLRGDRWDYTKELQRFSFETPEQWAFHMWCRQEHHSYVEACHVNSHGLTDRQITVETTAYTVQVDRCVRDFEKEQREGNEYVPLSRTILCLSRLYRVGWGQQSKWLASRPFLDSGEFYRSTEGANAVKDTGVLIFDSRWECSKQPSRLILVTTRCNCGTLQLFYTEEEIGDIHGCEHKGLYEVSAISIDDYDDLLHAYMAQLNDSRTSFFMFYYGDPATEEDLEEWPEGFYKMETPTRVSPPCAPTPWIPGEVRITHSQCGAVDSDGHHCCIVCLGSGCTECQDWSPVSDVEIDGAVPPNGRHL